MAHLVTSQRMSVARETHPLETPILDSGVLPEKKRASFGANMYGVLLGIPSGLALILAANVASHGRNSAGNFIFASYILAFLAVVIVHECGHLLAGWMVGFRFSRVAIGPFCLKIEHGRLKVEARGRLTGAAGYAGMHVNKVRR